MSAYFIKVNGAHRLSLNQFLPYIYFDNYRAKALIEKTHAFIIIFLWWFLLLCIERVICYDYNGDDNDFIVALMVMRIKDQ